MREDEALQVEDVSALLGVGRNTVYSLAKSGELASYRVGRKLRFTRADVERYIEASKTGGSPVSTGPIPVAPASAATPSSPYAAAIPEIAPAADPFVISGGDISGDIIAHAISGKGFPCSRAYLGSYLALVDLYLGRADAAVVHLFDRKFRMCSALRLAFRCRWCALPVEAWALSCSLAIQSTCIRGEACSRAMRRS